MGCLNRAIYVNLSKSIVCYFGTPSTSWQAAIASIPTGRTGPAGWALEKCCDSFLFQSQFGSARKDKNYSSAGANVGCFPSVAGSFTKWSTQPEVEAMGCCFTISGSTKPGFSEVLAAADDFVQMESDANMPTLTTWGWLTTWLFGNATTAWRF